MAGNLQELRKSAGYKTAPEFARAMGIPESTYARYESSSDKIPLDKAWKLADHFDCSIDVIVDREPACAVCDARGDVQRVYEGLSPDSKIALDRYLAFLAQSDADDRVRAEESERRRFEVLATSYETLFISSLNEGAPFGKLAGDGDAGMRRADFETFITLLAKEKRGETANKLDRARDEAAIGKIMDAYDRIHWAGHSCLERGFRTDPSDRLFISFDSSERAKKGGANKK